MLCRFVSLWSTRPSIPRPVACGDVRVSIPNEQSTPEEEAAMSERDSGPEAGAKGIAEGVKGKFKEAAGAITGKDDLRREGIAQQEKADAQRDVATKEAEAEKARAEAAAREAEQRSHQD
jgi:uncharacterized protein YjbJ (UPF0337 family)